MQTFQLAAALLVLAALFAYLNHRFLKFPPTIGLTALTLLASLMIVALGWLVPEIERSARAFVGQFDLEQALLHGMLGFMLFAGALRIDLSDLARQKAAVATLATVGVALSTVLVGGMTWCLLYLLGIPTRLIDCLLFGALISPTDPVAVLSLLKQIKAPKRLEVTIAGESLFNDGIGVVLFLGLLEVATGGTGPDPAHLTLLLIREVLGGFFFGLGAGLLAYYLLKSLDNYQVEVLLSLALVAGGYALADAMHVSGPIAMVVSGLLIGNHGRAFAMSPTTVENLDRFWELIDEILNAVLFVLLGLEVLAVSFTGRLLAAGLLSIPAVLLARFVSVGVPVWLFRRWRSVPRHTARLLTWGGLRGAISVALALSLPSRAAGEVVPERQAFLVMTYIVVLFSILVQGLTIGSLVRRWLAKGEIGDRSESSLPSDGMG
jgi:CPA1 family monovalent cation:H+ antiporter